MKSRFQKLDMDGVFDMTLDNSAPKQSIMPLLNALGVTFQSMEFWSSRPVDLEDRFARNNKFTEFSNRFDKK